MTDTIELARSIWNAHPELIDLLLKDQTTGENIIWATDHYISNGSEYAQNKPMTRELIAGTQDQLIQPRVKKSSQEQQKRTREKAEVFTPS